MRVAMLDMPLTGADATESPTEASARAGDRAAWNQLIARYDRRVVLVLLGTGLKPQQARDVAQEAWLRLIRQADAGKLSRLQLPGLAVRQALFLARSEARKAPGALTEPDGPSLAVESPEARYLALEALARAREHLAELSPSAQRVFGLLYAEPHLSHAEIAARIGLSVQRVRQIICEVRKELRAGLEGET
ncbi:MAG: sigma-70 family RNA polymerase sigma factor [Myxococcales bacterium]|nr:sigma-70 family RNA polymerase sigma factor [Myxococcales bacterium]